jgi:hypothetical protein
MNMKTTQLEVKSMLASLDSVRFREISTNLLYDCKIMDTGVISASVPSLRHEYQFY